LSLVRDKKRVGLCNLQKKMNNIELVETCQNEEIFAKNFKYQKQTGEEVI
jgi:hypothetical protein